jgi:hypothetical protein
MTLLRPRTGKAAWAGVIYAEVAADVFPAGAEEAAQLNRDDPSRGVAPYWLRSADQAGTECRMTIFKGFS